MGLFFNATASLGHGVVVFFFAPSPLCRLRFLTFCSFLLIFFHTTPFYMTHAMDYTGFGLTGGFMIKSNGVCRATRV